ncbi:hypothetical protein ABH14_03110 [Brevibacillus brevis]|uniref:hypothetical protein n=1 Tax=Brevibacillus brevis TaxID=1393 RepID=UPI0019021D6A|nr:hypothetical protein [Brevibacillus brevis]MBH0328793.1 hypothetical protein [Brevibacillus brevis]
MLLWGKDCTFFEVKKEGDWGTIAEIKKNDYEDIKSTKYENRVQIIYTWADSIKVLDKVVARQKRTVVLIFFISTNVVCCFGSSESLVTYAKNMLFERASLVLKKIDVFNACIRRIKNEDLFAPLSNVQLLRRVADSISDYPVIKIPVSELAKHELINIINSKDLKSMTFHADNIKTHFYLDRNSVLSFPDTAKDDDIEYVLEKFIQEVL